MRIKSEKSSLTPLRPSPLSTRRASALNAEKITGSLYDDGGALDSQTTDSQFFESGDYATFESPAIQPCLPPVKDDVSVLRLHACKEEMDVIDLCSSSPLASPQVRSRDPCEIISQLKEARAHVVVLEQELIDAFEERIKSLSGVSTDIDEPSQLPEVFAIIKSVPKTPLRIAAKLEISTEVIPETPQSRCASVSPVCFKLCDKPESLDEGEDENLGDPYIESIESQLYRVINRGRNE